MERQSSPKVEINYFNHVGGKRTALSSVVLSLHCWGGTLLSVQFDVPWIAKFSYFDSGDIIYSCHSWVLVAVPKVAFSRGSGSFFSLMHWPEFSWGLKRNPLVESFFSLLLGVCLCFPGFPRSLVLFNLGTLPSSPWILALWAVA